MPDEQPPSMGDHLGNAGVLPDLPFDGRRLKVSYYTPKIADAVEKQVAKRAIDAAMESADIDPGLVESTRRLLRRRAHAIGGELWDDAFATKDGSALLLWGCIQAQHPDFTPADAAKLVKDAGPEAECVLELVLPSFFAESSVRTGIPAEALMEAYRRRRAAANTARMDTTPTAPST